MVLPPAASSNESVEARIREINDAIQLLKSILVKRFEELNIYERLSVRYLIIQMVEASASICIRILLNAYNETVEGFPQCFTRLSSKNILPEELASRLRNFLVHRYWTISDEKVYESIKNGLKDFEEFIIHIRSFLERMEKHE
ncbi:MAG: HepT-like ribonuclease domain-containing protein [Thermoproteota archaeon]